MFNGPSTNGRNDEYLDYVLGLLWVVILPSIFVTFAVIRHNIFLNGSKSTLIPGRLNGWRFHDLALCVAYDSLTKIPTVAWNLTNLILSLIAVLSPYEVDGINRAIVMPLMLFYILSLVGRN